MRVHQLPNEKAIRFWVAPCGNPESSKSHGTAMSQTCSFFLISRDQNAIANIHNIKSGFQLSVFAPVCEWGKILALNDFIVCNIFFPSKNYEMNIPKTSKNTYTEPRVSMKTSNSNAPFKKLIIA